MACPCNRATRAIFLELDDLLTRHRYPEALAVANRGLRNAPDADLRARFRITRAHALWMTGRVGAARREMERALPDSAHPLTRARAHEALARFAWKEARHDEAQVFGAEARRLYEAERSRSGVLRSLQLEAAWLADAGRPDEALLTLSRLSGELARAQRAQLLMALGRWPEARAEFGAVAASRGAWHLEAVDAMLGQASLDVATGDLASARRRIDRARAACPASPRFQAEASLISADVHLVEGADEAAESQASEALRLLSRCEDRGGQCRSRIRRAHALLGLGRGHEAVAEASRAVRDAQTAGGRFMAWAQLSLGRALLGTAATRAREAFDRAEAAVGVGSADLAHAARLGRALAAGGASVVVDEALAALEKGGDRRLLRFAHADARRWRVGSVSPRGWLRPSAVAAPVSDGHAGVLVDAALALSGEGDWPARWALAMGAVRRALPFGRGALVVGNGDSLEISEELTRARRLPEADPARDLARRAGGPAIVELPKVVVQGLMPPSLATAIVMPVGAGAALYIERGATGPRFSGSETALLAELGRLFVPHLAEAAEASSDEAPAGLVGRSAPMRALFAQVRRVAPSDVPVHVFGETGTGKERVAAALHHLSRAARGPFVPVNAASLSDELFDSQLFGHVRGAFSGAVADAEGYVTAAEGGTLFIDEVAELSPAGQAKLLRFLQEKEYRRVGEARLRRAKVRIVTAANVKLADRVAEKRFREDLMYRLDAVTLVLPPLRERSDDLLLLARHFLKAESDRNGVPIPRLTPDVAAALRAHSWPGNVRQLQNEMSRLAALAGGGRLRTEDFSPRVAGERRGVVVGLLEARSAFEREHVAAVLDRNGGTRVRAAAELGITRQALYEKMRRLGLGPVPGLNGRGPGGRRAPA